MTRTKAIIYILALHLWLILCCDGTRSERILKNDVAEAPHVFPDSALIRSANSALPLTQTVTMSETFDNGRVNSTVKHRLSPAGEKKSSVFSASSFILNEGTSLLAECYPGWVPVYRNESQEKLKLSVCLKIVILRTGEKNSGYIMNSTSLNVTSINISSNSSYINARVSFYCAYPCFCEWNLNLLIEKKDGYYWRHLSLYYNLDGMGQYLYASTDNLHRYKATIHSAYICMSEDTIQLNNGVFVLIKDLKYRAFTYSNNNFPDEDIAHCPSVFKEFAGIVAFTGSIIIVTLATIIWTSLRQLIRPKQLAGEYKLFGRRFEP